MTTAHSAQNAQYSRPLRRYQRLLPLALAALLLACQSPAPVVPSTPSTPLPPQTSSSASSTSTTTSPTNNLWRGANWGQLPGWSNDELSALWPALLANCQALKEPLRSAWNNTCEAARKLPPNSSTNTLRIFLESRLTPWQLINPDGSEQGLITGYYEPLLRGSRQATGRYTVPILGVPDDLITVDLSSLYPELKTLRLRGRLDGKKLVPYASSQQIRQQNGKAILYTDDAIALAFMQIQGSGQAQLPDGSRVRLAYAEQNGHPYKSMGRWLADQGELPLAEVSKQNIEAWARKNPRRLTELLDANPSYVFFREEAVSGTQGPKGAQGIPLTAERSIAIDPSHIPLGSLVFLASTRPDGSLLQRSVLAQDTGGAIRGRVRADFYYGFGDAAGEQAGRTKQRGQMWLLWPRDTPLPGNDTKP